MAATTKVEALQFHSYNGHEYNVGDTYDIDEQLADSVQAQGKAVRVDRAAHAKALQTKALKPSKSGKLKPVKPVKPVKAGKKARKGKK